MQSVISLTALVLSRVLTFSWITDLNTKEEDEEEEKQEIDEIIKGAVQCPSSVHWCAVHGINVWRIEEEGEEKKKRTEHRSVYMYRFHFFVVMTFFFLFLLGNFVFRFGELLFFFFFRLARVPNNLVKKWEEKVEEKSKEDGGEKKMGKQQI